MATAETLTSVPILPSPGCFDLGRRPFMAANHDFSSKKVAATSECATFDPFKHLQYTPPSKVYTMAELGYPDSKGVSSIGVSEPFPLFSAEAIQQMRAEVLSPEVRQKYGYASELAQCQLRGYAAE